jgi:HTH-type transcriptional regulator/antitoxin HigA
MVEFINALLDEIGDNEAHPLAGLLDVVATFVHDFEERNVQIPDA